METRALVEAKTEAEQLIDTTEKFLQKNASLLTDAEIQKTQSAISELKNILDSSDKNLIREKTEILNEISRPYAERVMDEAISKAMSGKNIEDAI
jgi:molecular chaperone HscA